MSSSLPKLLETGINVFISNSQIITIKTYYEKSTIYKLTELSFLDTFSTMLNNYDMKTCNSKRMTFLLLILFFFIFGISKKFFLFQSWIGHTLDHPCWIYIPTDILNLLQVYPQPSPGIFSTFSRYNKPSPGILKLLQVYPQPSPYILNLLQIYCCCCLLIEIFSVE